ncbi:hypothetical protein [Helicobacter didelphidarum]|nr:hypothetical protein [Helicobacter didelphidarum]
MKEKDCWDFIDDIFSNGLKNYKKHEIQMLAELFFIRSENFQSLTYQRLDSLISYHDIKYIFHYSSGNFILNNKDMYMLKEKYKSHLPKITCLVVEHLTKLFKSFGYYVDIHPRDLDFDFDIYVYNANIYRKQMTRRFFLTSNIKKVFHAKFLDFIRFQIRSLIKNNYEAKIVYNEFRKNVALKVLESKIL